MPQDSASHRNASIGAASKTPVNRKGGIAMLGKIFWLGHVDSDADTRKSSNIEKFGR